MYRTLLRAVVCVCVFIGLMFPPLHLGNTSYTRQAAIVFTKLDPSAYDWIIEVDLRKLLLVLKEQDGTEVRRYPVAGPKTKEIPKPLLKNEKLIGIVQRVIIDPWWYPTPALQEEWEAKGRALSGRIPPGNPMNAMGKAKIIIKFDDYPEPLRIHGTNQPRSIGQHASRGCIRMHNNDVLELAGFLQQKKSIVVFRYAREGKTPMAADSKI